MRRFPARNWLLGVSLALVLSPQAHATSLCRETWSGFQTKLVQPSNRLSFTNSPGPMGIGLCWWHSRLQRNANYLLEFANGGTRTEGDAAWSVIKGLSGTGKVQVVHGFHDLAEFSGAYSREMTESLGQWQQADSFLRFNWVNGLAGSNVSSPDALQKTMDDLYQRVHDKKDVVYQMLKMPGLEAHAWLVIGMKKLPTGGYELQVLDSNLLRVNTYVYSEGMEDFRYLNGWAFSPYTQRSSDLDDFKAAIHESCQAR